jgi:hypothetical protein
VAQEAERVALQKKLQEEAAAAEEAEKETAKFAVLRSEVEQTMNKATEAASLTQQLRAELARLSQGLCSLSNKALLSVMFF